MGSMIKLLIFFFTPVLCLEVFAFLSIRKSATEKCVKVPHRVVEVLLLLLMNMVGLMIMIVSVRFIKRNQWKKIKPVQYKTGIGAAHPGLYWFSKPEIERAINYENKKKLLGKGSTGQVYKGILPSGQPVAIKQLYKSNTSSYFIREVESLSRVRHPNLMRLLGCCIEDDDYFLVYEYCSKGNLEQHFLSANLTWGMKVKILRDCALALKYLHNYIDGCIVHRDIKLAHILLTHNMEAKLSDLGLAKMLGIEESEVYTDVQGTIGYMDPEYMSNGKLTSANDIYSFGVVILQLLSGQKVIEPDHNAKDQLIKKAKDVIIGSRPLTDFQDPRMKGKINTVDFEIILQVGVLCVSSSSSGRPTIDLVYEELQKVWKNTQSEMLQGVVKDAGLLARPVALEAQEVIRVWLSIRLMCHT